MWYLGPHSLRKVVAGIDSGISYHGTQVTSSGTPGTNWNPGTIPSIDGIDHRSTKVCCECGIWDPTAAGKVITGIDSGISHHGTQVTRSGTTGTDYQGSASGTWECRIPGYFVGIFITGTCGIFLDTIGHHGIYRGNIVHERFRGTSGTGTKSFDS